MKKLFSLAALSTLFLFSSVTSFADEKESITLLYPNWAEGIAMAELSEMVMTKHGFEVKATLLEPGPIFATLAKGDADIFIEAWLPNTHEDYWERYGDKLERVGVIFDDASTGLVVPDYVEIDSIEELNAHKKEFDNGKIYGIGAGAGIHRATIKAIEEYGLDYQQITSSESAMMASLRKATRANKPIVITGWQPHYKWDNYDLKMLEDPKGIYSTDRIEILSRQGFKEDKPLAHHFFANFEFNAEEINELIAMAREAEAKSRDSSEGIKAFYEKHQEKIDGWFAE